MKVTIHLHRYRWLKETGVIPPFPYTFPGYAALIRYWDSITVTFLTFYDEMYFWSYTVFIVISVFAKTCCITTLEKEEQNPRTGRNIKRRRVYKGAETIIGYFLSCQNSNSFSFEKREV
jgi:hypothetical protein